MWFLLLFFTIQSRASVHDLYNEATQAAAQKDVAKSFELFQSAAEHVHELSPQKRVELLYNLGNAAFALQKHEEALKAFEAVTECDSEHARAREKIEYLKKLLEQKKQEQKKQEEKEKKKNSESSESPHDDSEGKDNQSGDRSDERDGEDKKDKGQQQNKQNADNKSSSKGHDRQPGDGTQDESKRGNEQGSNAGDTDAQENRREKFGTDHQQSPREKDGENKRRQGGQGENSTGRDTATQEKDNLSPSDQKLAAQLDQSERGTRQQLMRAALGNNNEDQTPGW